MDSADHDPASESRADAFPVVGIGASAGGLEAFRLLLRALPTDTGMAFVLVQHLSPDHASLLADILGRETSMPVVQVEDEPFVEPDHIYVIPPNRNMVVKEGTLRLSPRTAGPGQHRPVDDFLRSLAEDRTDQAIGVILSGTGSDGTVGLEAIKTAGGITFAQDDSAQHQGMPRSALATGCVDFVLPPDQIATELARIGRHPYALPTPPGPIETAAPALPDEQTIERILRLLDEATGVDFTHYKSTTLYRRINRRMLLLKLDSLAEYLQHLQGDPAEARNLYRDILISVTRFFRDPVAYDLLKKTVFPRLFAGRPRTDPLRVWVLGCSTGEEAYSLAIALQEYAGEVAQSLPVQIFATDLNEHGIQKARAGLYARTIAQDVAPERLSRFFVEMEAGYQIAKPIRDLCVFARQNVLSDPPFSRLDLITCRNLLIYMEPFLQRKILPLFHYALKPGGFLWLGSSETVGQFSDLFQVEDSKHKMYTRKAGGTHHPLAFPLAASTRVPQRLDRPDRPARLDALVGVDAQKEADRLVMARYAPAGVVVNADLNILQFRGDTSPYLASAPGRPSVNVLKMAREGLLVGLRSALQRAASEGGSVRLEGLVVKANGGQRGLALEVVPLRNGGEDGPCFLVLFEPVVTLPVEIAVAPALEAADGERQVARLTQELEATREYLQSLVEEQEAGNEELQSANEEVQSSNEELQTVNEELQTSKEEIQSSNEELQTVNEELRTRNEQLGRANDDLKNFLDSTHLALVMLGPDLRIRRFTPQAEKTLHLLGTDVGRPLGDLNLPLTVPALPRLLTEVITSEHAQEQEVQDREGRWYSLRVRPSRDQENRSDGAVLVLVDIDAQKRAQARLQTSEEKYRLLVEGATGVALILLDAAGRVAVWNVGAERLFGYTEAEIVGQSFERFFTPDEQVAGRPAEKLRLAREHTLADDDGWRVRKDGTRFWASGVLAALRDPAGQLRGFSKIVRDHSEHKAAEDALRQSHEELEMRVRERTEALAALLHRLVTAQEDERRRIAGELHDQMGQLLAALSLGLENLAGPLTAVSADRVRQLQGLADQIGREIHELALALRPPALDELGLTAALTQLAESWSTHARIEVDLHVGESVAQRFLPGVETALFRTVQEALTNVARHARASRVSLVLDRREGQLVAIIEDNGQGFDAEASLLAAKAGDHLGLLGMRDRLVSVGGSLEIESTPGQGTAIFARIPWPRSQEGG